MIGGQHIPEWNEIMCALTIKNPAFPASKWNSIRPAILWSSMLQMTGKVLAEVEDPSTLRCSPSNYKTQITEMRVERVCISNCYQLGAVEVVMAGRTSEQRRLRICRRIKRN